MTAVSSINYGQLFTPGLKAGYGTAQNGYTTKFGFSSLQGAVVMSGDNDDAIATCDVSAGTGTVGLVDDAGQAVSVDTKIFFVAWGKY